MKLLNDRYSLSDELWERAERLIPAGTQTLSKGPNQFVMGVTPKYLKSGRGSHVFDVDGNEYIDYPMALGPILLGYNYPPVVEAVIKQVREGTTFTLMHPLEVEVSELLSATIPCAEMVRFAKNGADVTSAAVKVARAYTGREHIAYSGYHGCQDWYAVTTPRNKGIPKVLAGFMHPFEYNDLGSLERVFDERPDSIACVIMEVPSIEPAIDTKTGKNFLVRVKELAHTFGAVFILDEIVTGYRYSIGGAGKLYGVKPDLACFGKGMANGFAISALVGCKEIMRELEEVFFSMTYSGDTVGLAAARATINELLNKPVLPYIWETGAALHRGMNELADAIGVDFRMTGNPPRGGILVSRNPSLVASRPRATRPSSGQTDDKVLVKNERGEEDLLLKSIFLQETVKRGILFGGPVFISYSHTSDDIEATLKASAEAMEVLKSAIDSGDPASYLEGEPIGVVFRERK